MIGVEFLELHSPIPTRGCEKGRFQPATLVKSLSRDLLRRRWLLRLSFFIFTYSGSTLHVGYAL